jgi:hypothetical protein
LLLLLLLLLFLLLLLLLLLSTFDKAGTTTNHLICDQKIATFNNAQESRFTGLLQLFQEGTSTQDKP